MNNLFNLYRNGVYDLDKERYDNKRMLELLASTKKIKNNFLKMKETNSQLNDKEKS